MTNQGLNPSADTGRGGSEWLFLAAVLLVGFFTQCYFLRDWLMYDECQHYLVAKSPLLDDFVREFRMRAHPPISYLLMKPFICFGDSALFVRGLSFVCGLFGILLAYRVLRLATDSMACARWGALFFALMPPLVAQATEVRQYSLALVFLWAYLGMALKIIHGDTRLRSHVFLFLLAFLAVFTVYSSLLSVAAVSIVLYGPLLWRWLCAKRWGSVAAVLVAYLFIVGLFVWLIWFSFADRGVQRVYLSGSMYDGEWKGLAHVANYLLPGLWTFTRNILGDCSFLVVFALLAIWPFGRTQSVLRMLGVSAVLVVALRVIASFVGVLPLWGAPRHTVTDLPLVATATFCSLGYALGRAREKISIGPVLYFLVMACIVLCEALQLAAVPRPGITCRALSTIAHTDEFNAQPAPIVCNWRGRSLASWWYLAGRTPRFRGASSGGTQCFTYDDLTLRQVSSDDMLAEEALQVVRENGYCWVIIGYLWDGGARKARISLGERLLNSPDIRVAFTAAPFTVYPLRSIVYKLEAARR